MTIGPCFAIASAVITVPSVPIYLGLLLTFHKFRHKEPFNSPFFKISFQRGIFDILHLFNDWLIGMLPYLGLYSVIVQYDHIFAKLFSIVWWYSALAQKLSILLLAIERLACMTLNYNVMDQKTTILISLNWIVPALLTAPQTCLNFGYHKFNESYSLLLYWENQNYEWTYCYCCAFYCGIISLVCAVSYGVTFHKVYRHSRTNMAALGREIRTQVQLAVAGFVLFFLTFGCAIFCWIILDQENSFAYMTGLEQILFDVYCCVNPYLILGCSKATRTHVKGMLVCKQPEQFQSQLNLATPKVLSHKRTCNDSAEDYITLV